MIRLRRAVEAWLGHPVLGPVLLVVLAVLLALVALHALEHGLAGELFTCAIVAVAVLRLAVVAGGMLRVRVGASCVVGRAPPLRFVRALSRDWPPPPAAFPLRR